MRFILSEIGLNGFVFASLIVISLNGFGQGSVKDSLKIETLLAIDSDNYTSINQRRKFYKKADHLFTKYGYEIRWLEVAYKTVWTLQLAHSKLTGFMARSNPEIRQFISHGNKIILHDMLSKIRKMWRLGFVLKGNEALRWDAQMLSDEQDLIDPLYEKLQKENQEILDKNLKGCISRNVFGNPKFDGYVINQDERWAFGMQKMGYCVTAEMMPKPNSEWKNVKLKIVGVGKKRMMVKAY